MWISIAGILATAILPVLPQLIATLPSPYRDIASGVLALAGIILHRQLPPITAKST